MSGQGEGAHVACRDDRAKGLRLLRIAVMDQIPTVVEDAPSFHRHVARYLLHPALIRMDRHTSDLPLATLKVDEERDVVGH